MNMKVQRHHLQKAGSIEAPRSEARPKAGGPKDYLPEALTGDTFEAPRAHAQTRVNVDLTGGQPLMLKGDGPVMQVRGKEEAQGEKRRVVNPDLQAFMAEHEGMETTQDLVDYAYANGGDATLQRLCEDLHLDYDEVSQLRSVRLEEYVYSGPVLSDDLPSTMAEADAAFITQFGDPTYNPDGADSTHNCGPTSLAMALRASGNMPEGLTPEQEIDYARALMFPSDDHPTITVNGQEIPQLDDDGTDTSLTSIAGGARRSEANAGMNQTGWDNLDAALANGQPVVVNGTLSQEWADQFPGDYHLEGSGHMVAIVGRTEDGNYLVCDPLHPDGPVEMTRMQLATFTSRDPAFVTVGGGE
ncbi:C39 family peptidase [Myxococcus sp. RHSTA-1-4]|uniref:C39 family peptidase n=1 Tax=Myxococcus sp. RHSTA-1-4 TaxID=2874601 RepID=UPI001CBBE035|nr:C39 family peptidase [Myxococcus sp. RHSTA-1-4]MBZ4419836.1 C39 family peptidase [Myxococcus sp. RHSTA-1-4]